MKPYVLCALFALGASAAGAQDLQHPLPSQSQQDFFRVFGTTPPAVVAAPAARADRAAAAADVAAAARDMRGKTPIEALNAYRAVANRNTTDSTVITELLGTGPTEEPLRYLMMWHQVALDVTAIDHAPTGPGVLQQQVGPARSARALALVHQAMFEAANTIAGNAYESTLSGLPQQNTACTPEATCRPAMQAAAISEAAYQILDGLYPALKQRPLHSGLAPQQAAVTLEASAGPGEAKCPTELTLNLHTYYQCALDSVDDKAAREKGVAIGRAIAGKIRADRDFDGSQLQEPELGKNFDVRWPDSTPNRAFVQWLQDPVSKVGTALGGNWRKVRPFALDSSFELRPAETDAPQVDIPADADAAAVLHAARALKSYNAVVKWGGDSRLNHDGHGTSTMQPSLDGFYLAQYWAYDGTAYLCAPPRLYNEIAVQVLEEIGKAGAPVRAPLDITNVVDVARYLALVNFAMADAAIAAWDAKYYFQFPRPVTYIRAVQALDPDNNALAQNTGMVSSGGAIAPEKAAALGGGTASETAAPTLVSATTTPAADAAARDLVLKLGPESRPKWFPTGAQITNADNPTNITPAFPAYVSGHAAFGGAVFGVLRQFIAPTAGFSFQSDEFNGRNKDAFNYIRCGPDDPSDQSKKEKFCVPRPLTIDCAERENADSRLWMGVHWIDDADDGIVLGNRVAKTVYQKLMRPAGGQAPQQSQYSVKAADHGNPDAADFNIRLALLCDNVTLPDGWADLNDPDGHSGFGKLDLVDVSAN